MYVLTDCVHQTVAIYKKNTGEKRCSIKREGYRRRLGVSQ